MRRSVRSILKRIATRGACSSHAPSALADCRMLAAAGIDELDRRARAYSSRICAECGERTHDDYMLDDAVWAQIALAGERWLHIACARSRLRRSIALDDLPDVPCNAALRHVIRDRDRQSEMLDNATVAWRCAQEDADRRERDLREILDALPERGEFARPAVEQIRDLVAALERIATYNSGADVGYVDEWTQSYAYGQCKEIARSALRRKGEDS